MSGCGACVVCCDLALLLQCDRVTQGYSVSPSGAQLLWQVTFQASGVGGLAWGVNGILYNAAYPGGTPHTWADKRET